MEYWIKEEGKFKYIEIQGEGFNFLLLYGFFGVLSNFEGIIEYFKKMYNVVVFIFFIFEFFIWKVFVIGFVDYVVDFVNYKVYEKVNVFGNFLGGYILLLYVLVQLDKISLIIFIGSLGLFESVMGMSFFKWGDYDFIKIKIEVIFYCFEVVIKELVDEVFDIVNDCNKVICVIVIVKLVVCYNFGDKFYQIEVFMFFVWGCQDNIMLVFVGEKFYELIENFCLVFLEECGYVFMMEYLEVFNKYLEDFLVEVVVKESVQKQVVLN